MDGNPFNLAGWAPYASTNKFSLNAAITDSLNGVTKVSLNKAQTTLLQLGVQPWSWLWNKIAVTGQSQVTDAYVTPDPTIPNPHPPVAGSTFEMTIKIGTSIVAHLIYTVLATDTLQSITTNFAASLQHQLNPGFVTADPANLKIRLTSASPFVVTTWNQSTRISPSGPNIVYNNKLVPVQAYVAPVIEQSLPPVLEGSVTIKQPAKNI